MKTGSSDDLTAIVTPANLRRLAGDSYFGRGEAYFDDGTVRGLRFQDGVIRAKVWGTREYRVDLCARDGELDCACTCPLGRDGAFCKHCVAVGLTWIAEGRDLGTGAADDQADAFREEDLRDFLLNLASEELVSLLLEQAGADDRLRRRLLARAARTGTKKPNLSVWKQALDDAARTDGFVHYRDVYDYVSGIEEVVDSIQELLDDGHATSVIELAEHGLAELEQGLDSVDDSDGWVGGLLERLRDLHLAACRQAKPDPRALAEKLFTWELETGRDTFFGAADTYADVLGDAGLAVYRRLAGARWAEVRTLAPGAQDPGHYAARFRITSIMEALARASGDIEELVAVKSRDLSSSYAFLRIAEIYRQAGQSDVALEWAERGWKSFPEERRDDRLREFIADAYHRQKRHDEAMALTWEAFVERPDFAMYKVLKPHARKARQWPACREKALAAIREHIAAEKEEPAERGVWEFVSPPDHSVLVEIFLHEKDLESAWREAEDGGCSEALRLELARRREKTHPEDAARIYQAHVARILQHANNSAYVEAVGYLERLAGEARRAVSTLQPGRGLSGLPGRGPENPQAQA